MKNYDKVKFKGTFRHYQQNVLDNAERFLEDGKIHIVAAPGSGKTTLGLELIRKLNEPALILSPSLTIRSQWGNRFKSGFLNDDEDINDYVSYSLKDPKLLTCITYQGLHSAFNQLVDEDESENEFEEERMVFDYSDFDLLKKIKEVGIKIICLDEAHHLRNEWYKTLKKFIDTIEQEVTIIALTATPPYDSTPFEWAKYEGLCGEIDEEIFVPELVQKGNLCPHQDYIYFNFPTDEEQKRLTDYHKTVKKTINDIFESDFFINLLNDFLTNYLDEKYHLFEYIEEYITLVQVARKLGLKVPLRLRRLVRGRKYLERFKIKYLENLFEFIIRNDEIFYDNSSKKLQNLLSENGLIERKKVNLNHSSKMKKQIISSVGKLNSIGEIARFESEQLKEKLQMLILTDYIKKDLIEIIGSSKKVNVMGAVPIFEQVRRSVNKDVRIALLSGSLIIIPNSIKEDLCKLSNEENISHSLKELDNASYSIVKFKGSNKVSVNIMTTLFESGNIDILIGTKSLLGEGWDSPSINTLILASFVGSYMLSNQMRGRAIRTDKTNPDKVASIWHLATVERNEIVGNILEKLNIGNYMFERRMIISTDYDMLERRFKSFIGPSYNNDYISSGIERIDYIMGPYTEDKYNEFNQKALHFAKNRHLIKEKWDNELSNNNIVEILDQSEIDQDAVPYGILFYDCLIVSSMTLAFSQLFIRLLSNFKNSTSILLIMLLLFILFSRFLIAIIPRLFLNIGPSNRIKNLSKGVLQTLKDIGEIKSKHSLVDTRRNKNNRVVYTTLSGATRHEKAVFTNSVKEMFSEIDNPRYLIISNVFTRKIPILNYKEVYAVPKVIGAKKEYVKLLNENLQDSNGNYQLIYTRNEIGRKKLLKAKSISKVNMIQSYVLSRRIVKENNK